MLDTSVSDRVEVIPGSFVPSYAFRASTEIVTYSEVES